MTFLFVATWVGVALAVLMALLVLLLYLLRPPPQQLMVPSRLLWQLVLEEQDKRRTWLRWLLSLLISLVAGLALLGALTGFERSPTGSRDLFLVLDDSPTMATLREDGRTRFDHAKEHARARVVSAGGAIHLATTSGSFGPTRVSREEALEALADFAPRLRTSARFPSVPPELKPENADLVLLTDGVTDLPNRSRAGDPIQAISVFERATNVGILSFEAQAVPGASSSVQAFLEITNASDKPAGPLLRVGPEGGAPVLEQILKLGPLETWSGLLEMPVDQLEVGVSWLAQLRLEGDALRHDDRAWLFPPDVHQTQVTLIRGPEPRPELARALSLDQSIQLSTLAHQRYDDWEPDGDVLVFAGFAPPEPPPLPWLLIAPPAAPWLPPAQGAERSVAVAETMVRPPLSLELHDLEIELLARYPSGGRALLAAELAGDQVPLLFEWQPGTGDRNATNDQSPSGEPGWILAFEPGGSNLVKKEAFPMLLAQAVHALGNRGDATAGASTPQVAGGLRRFGDAVTAVTDPNGARVRLQPAGDGSVARLDAPGVYRVRDRSGSRQQLAVPPVGRALSLVNRTRLPEQPAPGLQRVVPTSLTRTVLLIIALTLIVGEMVTLKLGFTE